jgi:hypothetical protein
MRRAQKSPVPKVSAPHFRSCLVPSSGRAECFGTTWGCKAVFAMPPGLAAGSSIGTGWVAGANFFFGSALPYFAATSMILTITPVTET